MKLLNSYLILAKHEFFNMPGAKFKTWDLISAKTSVWSNPYLRVSCKNTNVSSFWLSLKILHSAFIEFRGYQIVYNVMLRTFNFAILQNYIQSCEMFSLILVRVKTTTSDYPFLWKSKKEWSLLVSKTFQVPCTRSLHS